MDTKLEAYLKEVKARLRGRPEAEQREIIATLRQHIEESLVRHKNNVDAVLMELDEPDAYAGDEDGREARNSAAHPKGGRVFSYRLLLWLFLLINGWWVFMQTQERGYFSCRPANHRSAKGATRGNPVQPPAAPMVETNLVMLEVRQQNFSSSREMSIAMQFNVPPAVNNLREYLRLTTEDGEEIPFGVMERYNNQILLMTESLKTDTVKVSLAAGFPSADGVAVSRNEQKRTLTVIEKLILERMETELPDFESGFVGAYFTFPLDAGTARDFIQITPPVKFMVERGSWWRNESRIVGEFKPRESYTITFKSGLRAENGAILLKPVVRTIQFPDRDPALAIPVSGMYLSPKGNLQIPLSAVNVKEVELSAAPVLPQNLLHYALRRHGRAGSWYREDEDRMLGRSAIVLTNRLAGQPNQQINTRVDLRSLVAGTPSGAYWVTARAKGDKHAEQLVVVTDLGLSAHLAKDGVFVWVNSLAETTPAVGAEVVAYAENNEEVGRGIVQDDGTVFLPKKEGADDAFIVIARLGTDLSYLVLDRSEVDVPNSEGVRPYASSGYEAFVFTERGVYRPGESAFVRTVVRDRLLGAPDSFPVSLRVVRPDGRTFRTFTMKLDDVGSCETNFALPEYLPTGLYSLDVIVPGSDRVLGSTSVALEDFVPPQVRVDILGLPPVVPSSTGFIFTVSANHLFGAPGGGLLVSAFYRFYAAPFVATNWVGYSFGDPEKEFSSLLTYIGRGWMGSDGLADFPVSASPAWRPAARLRAVVSANVSENSGRVTSAYGETLMDPYPFYIGLSPSFSGTMRVGDTQRVAIVAVRPSDMTALTNGALKAVLSRVTRSWALKRGANGRYNYESLETKTPVREVVLSLAAEPVSLPLQVESSGEYLLVVSDPESEASTSIRFSAAAPGDRWVDWNRERPDIIELSLNKSEYRIGEKAKLIVKAPFKGEGLLTIETDRVLEHRRVTLDASTAELELDVRADYVPNAYCTFTLIRPAVAEAEWSAHRAVGGVALRVRPEGRALSVAIDAPRTNLPQAKMTAKIRVRDEAGAPASAKLTVMAVDEGICLLTAFKTPNPLQFFLAKRTLGTSWFDLYSELMPVLDDDEMNRAASHIGGDVGSSLLRRMNPVKSRRFKPLALWQSEIETDAQGEAEVSFDLPEFAGEVRLMVVAVNREQLGSAEVPVKVKRPLVVETSLPRFLAPGDRTMLTVQLFNESGTEQHVKIEATAGGPLSVVEAQRSVTLAAGQSSVERMPVQALKDVGNGLISIRVESEAVSFSDQIEMPVRPALALQYDSIWGTLTAGEKQEFAPSETYLPNTAEQIVQASGLQYLKLADALNYLVSYPYGCLEQTTSRAYPMIYLPELAKRLSKNSMSRDEIDDLVRTGIFNILAKQSADGSFSMWHSGGPAWRWGGLYATSFLLDADRLGYEVSKDALRSALDYVERDLSRRPPATVETSDFAWRSDITERAFACEVLARAGRRSDGWIARLAEQLDVLPNGAKISLARAMVASGDPRRASEILKAIKPDSVTDVVDQSALLLAWLDVDPRSPVVPLLAMALEKGVSPDGHWSTTTYNAFAVRALGSYAMLMTNAMEPFKARMLSDGKTVAFDQSKELQFTNAGPVTLVNDGPGVLYYRISASGVPVSGEPEIGDNELVVRRTWFTEDGYEITRPAFDQGELVVVEIAVDSLDKDTDNLIIEDLLPAGFEIENPALQTSQDTGFGWITGKVDWVSSRDIRDDRLLLFSGAFNGRRTYYYAMRAVSPGHFVVPAITASEMYNPMRRSVWRDAKEATIDPAKEEAAP